MSDDTERKYIPPEIKEQSQTEAPPPGWMTRGPLVAGTGRSFKTIEKIVEPYRSQKPEWFRPYLSKRGVADEHFSPELIGLIIQESDKYQLAPEGWQVLSDISDRLGFSHGVIKKIADAQRNAHPEWFFRYVAKNKKIYEHFAPELVKLIEDEVSKRKEPPVGWVSTFTLTKETKRDASVIKSFANKFRKEHPEWFQEFKTKTWITEHYSPELANIIRERIENLPPDKWLTPAALSNKIKKAENIVKVAAEAFRQSHPEWFKEFTSRGGTPREHYSPELIELITEKLSEKIPEGWKTQTELHITTARDYKTLNRVAEPYRKTNPDWFRNYRTEEGIIEHFSPELAAIVVGTLSKEEEAPPGWLTANTLVKETKRNQYLIASLVEKYRESNPEWFRKLRSKGRRLTEHFSPELVAIINQELFRRKQEGTEIDESKVDENGVYIDSTGERWISLFQLTKNYKLDKRTVAGKLKGLKPLRGTSAGRKIYYREEEASEILDQFHKRETESAQTAERERFEKELKGTLTEKVQEFRKLVSLFGASRFADILYINHPQYRGIPVGRVKSVIAKYLGDFLVIRHSFNIADLKGEIKYLSDVNLKEGLFEVMKDSCLRFYHEQKKANPGRNDLEIIDAYTAKLKADAEDFLDTNLKDLIESIGNYYYSLFEKLAKPEKIVGSLKKDREFPDINQRINIREIEDKKRILIADEMGLGKSASAILAKECLGVRQALVVTPSNVIDTWKNYLSDLKAEDGTPIGYFKEGQAPKVLVVWDLKSLQRQDIDTFDYILISQERLTTPYMKLLRDLNFGMMIIDEVHKLKNLREGQRSENIVSLSEKVEGEGKYLALLSGTPVPNKVEDVAIILKLLYPEKFKDIDNKDLVRSIIKGDLVDLRALLVPRMQMKNLQESVEMPQLDAQVVDVDLNELERDIYEVLIEEDEITATQKIQIMRQFLLNPHLIDPTPGIESSKQASFRESLIQEFKTKDKVVVFVNGYVEGIIRGDKNILKNLGLPPDIEIMVIEGKVSKERRKEIQIELNQSDKKILLFVNGQTADVGVDFTGGEAVDFYNEPWSKYDIAQQLARVYRPGLKSDLTSKTFITRNTIEEGIHQYIDTKQRSIGKLLKGIPITELERELLTRNETQVDPNLEVNPELAAYYFTAWDRMMKIFSEVKEIGEQSFIEYTAKHGREYASCYFDLGSRSYQANGSRLVGTMINRLILEAKQNPKDVKILDIASGPEMLKKHVPDHLQSQVYSMDINKYHFAQSGENRIVGSFGKLPIQSKSLDYANLSLALHYTKFIPSEQEFERLEVLMEMNRVLKEGGKAIINLIYSLDLKNEEEFVKVANALGFKVVEGYSGEVVVGRSYRSRVLTLEKERDVNLSLAELLQKLDRKNFEGLKFRTSKVDVRDTRKMFNQFQLADKSYFMDFNTDDADVFEEERAVISFANELKSEYGAIELIPRDLVIDNNFVRFFDGNKYILFKKLENNRGIVVVK